MAVFGTYVLERAVEIVSAITLKDCVVSLPPKGHEHCDSRSRANRPFSIAAFPDLIASDAILAITSGRASNMIKRTPIGEVILSRSSPSSKRVLRVTLPTISYRVLRSVILL